MLKKLLFGTAAFGALVLAATAVRPQFAHGTESCFLGTPLCWVTFSADTSIICPIGAVDVTASADVHDYQYAVQCANGYQGYSVRAAFKTSTRQAVEKISGPGFLLEANWTCSLDPWSTPNAPYCINLNAAARPDMGSFGFVDGSTGPVFSIQNLDTRSIQALAAQLQNALNQPQTPSPQPASAAKFPSGAKASNTSVINPSTFLPKPDLVAVGISGPTALNEDAYTPYTATVRNDGAAVTGQVEVVISYADPLENIDGDVIAAPGFSCSSSSNFMMDCVGGSLAQGQSATISFNVYAIARPGLGTLQITINPHNAVTESSTSNNTVALTVTVN